MQTSRTRVFRHSHSFPQLSALRRSLFLYHAGKIPRNQQTPKEGPFPFSFQLEELQTDPTWEQSQEILKSCVNSNFLHLLFGCESPRDGTISYHPECWSTYRDLDPHLALSV
jgi:hypothetical protein